MLLLHIGRGKAGSSTIQNTIDLNHEALLAQGIAVPSRASEHRGHAVDVSFGMQQAEGHEDALPGLRALLDDAANRHVFVSSEYLFTATRPEIDRLRQAIGPHDVRIVAYLRAYPDWLRSLYAQGIKRGRRASDFDAFFETAAKRAPSRAPLSRWAEAFGWERLRVRHLAGLDGGGLVADLESVLGCPLAAGPDQNASPHWIETEFLRAVHGHAASTGDTAPPRAALAAVLTVLREAIDLHAPDDAMYLTLSQHRALEDAYLADAAWLAQRTDAPLPPPLPDRTRERPFLPELAATPQDVRETIARRLRRSLRLKEQPEVRALVLATIAEHWPQARDVGDDAAALPS
ncbi:hypothetical protein RUR49_22385 [Pseudoxanthobacter sp. M-2]|uniref:hypothetical protein n=1 Tax=Pseudoxanthobacter sp. M-2 TaxID=3078754 RepID=UPI0038FC54E6